MQERLCTSRVTPVCGSPEGCQALGALPYGKGGFGRVETKKQDAMTFAETTSLRPHSFALLQGDHHTPVRLLTFTVSLNLRMVLKFGMNHFALLRRHRFKR